MFLSEQQKKIENSLTLIFDDIIKMRPEGIIAPSTGIQMHIQILEVDEIILPSAYTPSEMDIHHASEKVLWAHENKKFSSRLHNEPTEAEFPGGLIAKIPKLTLLCGTAGLTGDENEVVSFIQISRILQKSLWNTVKVIYPNQKTCPANIFFPDDNIGKPEGYLWSIICRYVYL